MSNLALPLSEPTVFPDLNAKENRDASYARDEIKLIGLKYKHFRAVMNKPEDDQMHYLMLEITGLSDGDAGELTPNDAAELYHIIFHSMRKYMELGQKVLRGED